MINLSTDIKTRYAAILLGILIIGLYANSLTIPWYLDDFQSIVNNPTTYNLKSAISKILEPRGLSYFTFALNNSTTGMAIEYFHLTNIVLHWLNGLLVFLILNKIFRQKNALCLLGALIFVAHPIQTQAVNYIVQRMTLLSSVFLFSSIYLFIVALNYRNDYKKRPFRFLAFYIASIISGGISVLAKQNTATLPLLLLLIIHCSEALDEKPTFKQQTYMIAPFLVVPGLLAFSMLIMPTLSGESLATIGTTENLLTGPSRDNPSLPLHYFATQLSVLWIYIKLFFMPVKQVLDYGYPIVDSLISIKTILAGLGHLALIGLAFYWKLRKPLITLGIFWFYASLLVESSVIPLDPIFEHRLYIPLFGTIILLLYLVDSVIKNSRLFVASSLVLMALCSFLTISRNNVWSQPIEFFKAEVERTYSSYRPFMMLGDAYFNAGRYNEARNMYGEISEKISSNSLTNIPPKMLLNLAVANERLGNLEKAENLLLLTISKSPKYQQAHYNLGIIHYKKGKLISAQESFLQASQLAPGHGESLYNYASVTVELGDTETASSVLPRLKKINPALGNNLAEEIRVRNIK